MVVLWENESSQDIVVQEFIPEAAPPLPKPTPKAQPTPAPKAQASFPSHLPSLHLFPGGP